MIVSCSCFNPTPSLAAMVVNHFDMKESTLTYNLGGMGCSSSLVSVDLAKHLLQARAGDLVGWDACTLLASRCLLRERFDYLRIESGLQLADLKCLCNCPA